ncbi:MAG TPA: filamentous hemagglutinin N-terminal domain-containing protein [Trinickia sp.]|nr:filamentous hemagglutinin N-terminal domain-containing protein [Trinickia sp.]
MIRTKFGRTIGYRSRRVATLFAPSACAAAALTLCTHATLALGAGALPQGGQFVAGAGAIAGNATSVTVNQSSSRGIIDWGSFSIGAGQRVTFNNGNGATLNRVTGGDPSQILGTLTGTGSVYLVNPQGVLIGKSGIVSTGGRFVASTLDTDNTLFMLVDNFQFTGASNGKVVNLGRIESKYGDVFLIASSQVENAGDIHAPNGTVELAAARQMLLATDQHNKQVYVQMPSGGTVINQGAIEAAQVSLQAADGNVYALSGNHTAIRATGTATRDGHIWLVADRGWVRLGGRLEAKNADSSGGTVDTEAGTIVFCHCIPTVSAGIWNIITPSIAIGSREATVLTRNLNAGTSINVQATADEGRSGDIAIGSNIGWSGSASLGLNAYHSVHVNDGVTIENVGSGNLTLHADSTAIDNGGSVTNQGTIDWSKSTGIVNALYDMNGSYAAGAMLGNTSWTPPENSGLLTQITAYRLVNSADDLRSVAQDLFANYALGRDVEFAGTSLTPIGDFVQPYSGQFDGFGHVIDGAVIGFDPAGGPSGVFGVTNSNSVVRNLGVTNSYNAAADSSFAENGLLAGVNFGTIFRTYSTGTVGAIGPGRTSSNGGLVGENGNGALILQSWSGANVAGFDYAGGLVGTNIGTIKQSYATGSVSPLGSAAMVGGLAGASPLEGMSSIVESFASGPVAAWQGGGISLPPGAITAVSNGTAVNNYWNIDTTGLTFGGIGIPSTGGLTAAQMRDPASFVGWDFGPNGVWAMPNGATHPVLKWQVEKPAAL